MEISWTSRQGRRRRHNSDAAAIGYCDDYLVATIVDAAEKEANGKVLTGTNERGERLAQHWAISSTAAILGAGLVNDVEGIIAQLAEHQKILRNDFLHDIASYGVLIINGESGAMKWIFTGDCRLGLQSNAGKIEWVNSPHRLENAELYQRAADHAGKTQPGSEKQIAQHMLTQSLNARRFVLPEVIELSLAEDTRVLAATDGFWCEHIFRGVEFGNLEDDASWLKIAKGSRTLHETTDTPNFHQITEDSD